MKHEYRGRGEAWGRKANGLKQCNGEGPTLRREVSHLGVVYVHIHLHIWENGLAPPPQLTRPTLFLSSPTTSSVSIQQLHYTEERKTSSTEILFCFFLSDFFCDASLRAKNEGRSFFGEKEEYS